ncbi:MAG TPA: hypothetical protein VEH04_08155 [Verrucomicrobiae bacterium]|nr:hypothetical protein [Verrucomicrobiae bacterium]
MKTEAMMRHLIGPFWFATRKRFLEPGLYHCNRFRNKRIIALPTEREHLTLTEFPEQTVVIAKDQPEYRPLPAYRFRNDPEGKIICCWKLTMIGRIKLLFTGKLWHQVLTFNGPLQPQLITLEKPEMPK